MSNLSPTNLETADYGTAGWNNIFTSNWQKLNDYWNKIWVLESAGSGENDKVIKYNNSSGKWEVTTFTSADIQGAINKEHTQGTDQYLDKGGSNEVSVADVKDAVDKRHNQQHSIISTADHTSTATPGRLLKADDNGLPIDATNTDAEVSGAVTKANSALQNVVDDTSPQAGGEFNFAAHSAGFTEQSITSSSGAATIDWTKGNKAAITLTEDVTFTFINPNEACNLTLRLVQDSTGGRTVTWPSGIKWAGGVVPTLTPNANAVDIISFYFANGTYYGMAGLNFG